MTNPKPFKFGNLTFKPYFKPVGQGWEVGVTCLGKPVFVGNFVHHKEAKTWWKMMNTHLRTFCNKHEFVPTASPTWYCKYLGNYLYTPYYQWLDKTFAKYTKTYSRQTTIDFKKYKTLEKHFYIKTA